MIAEMYAADTALQPIPVPSGADFVEQLEGECGLVLGHLIGFIRTAFGFSVMEELVHPLIGDWTRLEVAHTGWDQAARASEAVGRNYAAVPEQTLECWQGEAAEAFRARMGELADCHAQYAEGCRLIGELTQGLVDVAKAAAEALATVISFIGSFIERLAMEAAIPVGGWIAGGADVALHAKPFWDAVVRGYAQVRRVLEAIKAVVEALHEVVRVLKLLTQALHAMTTALRVDAARMTGDAAAKAFGAA